MTKSWQKVQALIKDFLRSKQFLLPADRSGFLPVNQQAEADPGTIAQYADDTPATLLPDIEKYRVRNLPSIGDKLNDDDEANAAWKLVPFYVVAVLLVFPLLLALKTL